MRSIFSTTPTYWQLVPRFCLATVFWVHGSQKVLGLYGGPGLQNFIGWMTSSGVPVPLAYLAAFAEFLGSLGMAFGFLTRIAAFGIMCNMAVATATVHWKNGFLLSSGQPGGGAGYEYTFTLFCVALTMMIGGAGNLSVDRIIATRGAKRVAGFAPA